ncbi:hypothetical protein [Candidatus Carsonella ruddii]|nr:hypothetical protein [Candidatus Carsonella ruddii]WMC18184.1 MAG: hypothetical protein NU472_00660 [Candidatus Carsonella ruddii]WMC18378.1 MAG: hypothetical protein NU470_00655 [Candidatus Carsonella ruddii]WMC18572.1 MAG: hypothetical protein NU471_00665 [Candidatus Carsonella ruddii]WMC19976.1 MAG: hypothetical protein NVS90_00660 [Candidatus Carsonella ruddii]
MAVQKSKKSKSKSRIKKNNILKKKNLKIDIFYNVNIQHLCLK